MFVRARSALAAFALTIVAGMPSSAQMGEPFTAASLESALKGMRVYKARMTDIVAMRVQYINVSNRRSEAFTKAENEISAYHNKQSTFRDCVSDKIRNDPERNQKVQQKIMGMASNPTAMQKYAELSQAQAVAIQKGDTAAAIKVNTELMKLLGVDPKADTVAATAACGGAPRRPASVTEVENLEKQADSITIRLRRAENAADGDAARAAGVAPSRFAEMRERLATYVSKPSMFAGAEAALLAAHKAEIVSLTKE